MQDEENIKEKSKEKISDNTENSDGQVYELGYLLVPTLSSEDIPIIYTNLKDQILSMGGEIISDEMPKMMTLAYTMQKVHQNVRNKFDTAYFGWVKFEMQKNMILELKKKLNLDANFVRFLILKTVKENTIAAKRFLRRDFRKKITTTKREEESVASQPINKEEIDKEIDAMIAV